MDVNILPLHAAAFAGLFQTMGAEQGEAFRDHAGRAEKFADGFQARGAIAGFLLQFATGGDAGILVRVMIADKARGQFDAAPPQRHAILIDQQDMPVIDGQNDSRPDAPRATDIFPFAASLRRDEAPGPHHFFGGGRIRVTHNSISLSGSSLMSSSARGKWVASTSPT